MTQQEPKFIDDPEPLPEILSDEDERIDAVLCAVADTLAGHLEAMLDARIVEDRNSGREIPVVILHRADTLLEPYIRRIVQGKANVCKHPERVRLDEVDSSNIKAFGYDGETRALYVTFEGSGDDSVYVYFDVSSETHANFKNAESHGSFHHAQIKGEYACALLEDE